MSYIYPQGGQQTVIIPGGATTAYAQPYGQQTAYIAQQPYAAGGVPMATTGGYAQPMMAGGMMAGGMGQPVVVAQPGVGSGFAVGGSTPFGLAGGGVQSGIGGGLGTGLQGGVTTAGHLGPFTAQSSFGAGVQPGLGRHHILGGGVYGGGMYPYGGY